MPSSSSVDQVVSVPVVVEPVQTDNAGAAAPAAIESSSSAPAIPDDSATAADEQGQQAVDASADEPVTPTADQSNPTKAKRGIFGSLFRRGNNNNNNNKSTVNASTEPVPAADDVAAAPTDADEAVQQVAPEEAVPPTDVPTPAETSAGDSAVIDVAQGDAVVEPASETSAESNPKPPKSPKFFSFHLKKNKKSDSVPATPVIEPQGASGSTSVPLSPIPFQGITTFDKSLTQEISDAAPKLDTPVDVASEGTLNIPVVDSADAAVEHAVDSVVSQAVDAAVVDDHVVPESAPDSSSTPVEEKKKSGFFARIPLLRKSSSKEPASPKPEDPVEVVPAVVGEVPAVGGDSTQIVADESVAVSGEGTTAVVPDEVAAVVTEDVAAVTSEEVVAVASAEESVAVIAEESVAVIAEEVTAAVSEDVVAKEVVTEAEQSVAAVPDTSEEMPETEENHQDAPKNQEKRQSTILGLIHSITGKRTQEEPAVPATESPAVQVEESTDAAVPETTTIIAPGEEQTEPENNANEEPTTPVVTHPAATKKHRISLFRRKTADDPATVPDEVAEDAGAARNGEAPTVCESIYGKVMRMSYLLKPAALTRAIHRRHFTLHQSGEIVMRTYATDPREAKVYNLTEKSTVSIPEYSKIDYELAVKVNDRKTVSFVMGSESERDAWVHTISGVISHLKNLHHQPEIVASEPATEGDGNNKAAEQSAAVSGTSGVDANPPKENGTPASSA